MAVSPELKVSSGAESKGFLFKNKHRGLSGGETEGRWS